MAAKTTLTDVILNIQMVNMKPLDDFFGGITNARFFDTKEIQWDLVDIKNTPAQYHPLTQKALIVDKEGFARLKMTPPTINEGIVRDSISAGGLKAGELEIKRSGQGSGLDAEATRQLETAVVLIRRYKTRLLLQAGEALSVGGITVNKDGDKLFYNVPAGNKFAPDWSLSTTSRIDTLKGMLDAMRENDRYPTRFVFGSDSYSSLLAGNDIKEDSDSSGKGKTLMYYEPTEAEMETGYYRTAKVNVEGKWYDVYVWEDTYKVGANTFTYFPKTAISLTSLNFGAMAYGAVNVANDATKQVDWRAMEFFAKEGEKTGMSDDNPEYKDIFKAAPAVIIPDGNDLAIADVTTA